MSPPNNPNLGPGLRPSGITKLTNCLVLRDDALVWDDIWISSSTLSQLFTMTSLSPTRSSTSKAASSAPALLMSSSTAPLASTFPVWSMTIPTV
jgi:hypothetical protein